MLKVTKVNFTDNERIGAEYRHEYSPRPGLSMTYDPEVGILCFRMGETLRFYSPSAYRSVECVEVKEVKEVKGK